MRIDTKFDIGQKVWRIKSKRTYARCKVCKELKETDRKWSIDGSRATMIRNMSVHLDGSDQTEYYEFFSGRSYSYEPEELFPTKSEAQAECAKRNGRSK